MGDGLQAVWGKIQKVVEALGGWQRVGEMLFTSWAISKLDGIAIAIAGIGLALANPAVLAALAAWAAYYAAASQFRVPETQEQLDAQFTGLPSSSPLWNGIPREQQLRYPNSPASRGAGDASLGQRLAPWLFGQPSTALADESMTATQRGFLDALSFPESHGDYSIMNGGKERVTSFDAHPNRVGRGGTSTAAGRYQFTADTWREAAAANGLSDFSPRNQDRAAWWLAAREYQRKTGRDLHSDLQTGGHEASIASALKGRWPSLPGGSQSNQSQSQFNSSIRQRTDSARTTPLAAPPIPFTEPGFVLGSAGNTMRGAPASSTISNQANITGPITITTQATDAVGIAQSLREELARRSLALQGNTGLV